MARSLRCCRRRLRLLLLPEAVRPAFRPASALLLQRHQHSQGHQGRSWLAMVAGTNGGQHVGQVGAHVLAEREAVRDGCAGSGQAVRAARPGAGDARRHFCCCDYDHGYNRVASARGQQRATGRRAQRAQRGGEKPKDARFTWRPRCEHQHGWLSQVCRCLQVQLLGLGFPKGRPSCCCCCWSSLSCSCDALELLLAPS